MSGSDDQNVSRTSILDLMDSFIKKIMEIRRALLGVSVSSFFLAPFAIALSIFLIRHPSFFRVLEKEDEFGTALSILLGVIISFSIVWIITGIKQYLALKSWNKKYQDYAKQKDEVDKKIASDYGLDKD